MFCFAPNHQLYFPFLFWGSYWVSLTLEFFLLVMSPISFNSSTLCYFCLPRLSFLLCGNKVLSASFTFLHQPFIFVFRLYLFLLYIKLVGRFAKGNIYLGESVESQIGCDWTSFLLAQWLRRDIIPREMIIGLALMMW